MKKVLTILLVCIGFYSHAQKENFNLDFEKIAGETHTGWRSFGSPDYKVSVDSNVAQSGKTSAIIEYHGDAVNFKAMSVVIPAKYAGSLIKLTGYIKTENVTDGYAGLWMRIDPSIAFDNMGNRGITGTTDWAKYEIELALQPSATGFVVGGILSGKGKMWVDNLTVTIDGKSLDEAPLRPLPPTPLAQKDTEFNNGSNIVISELNDESIDKLELMGRIWGFLKYHHPAIGTGDYNWDFELFRILPDYLKADAGDISGLVSNWLDKFGTVEECSSCQEVSDEAFSKLDMAWLDRSDLSAALKQRLRFIQQNRHQGEHYYIGLARGVRNPEFKNESAYANMPYPDDGFRLLTIYRYWNMIQYFFPYKHLMDKDWEGTLKEYIPQFLSAKNELEFEIAAIKAIGDIQDTHANLWGGNNAIQEWKGKNYPPVHVRFVENELVITDFYNEEHYESLGLQIGDVIASVNGNKVEDIVNDRLQLYPASNLPTKLRDISRDVLRSNEESLSIEVERGERKLQKELPLFDRKDLKIYGWYKPEPDGKSFKMLNDDIGYITLKNIKPEDISEIKKQFANTKGIVIDIRNYPSTFVPFSLGGFFVSELTPFVKFTKGNVNNPGEFTFTETIKIPSQESTYKGKVIVLVNELSQSQAEYTTMAFRAGNNTTVIGSTTAGADGNVSAIPLPGGMRTMISGIGVYYPDGTETQRVGIIPDIKVLPTIVGVREGRDELLEKAIEVINSTNVGKRKR